MKTTSYDNLRLKRKFLQAEAKDARRKLFSEFQSSKEKTGNFLKTAAIIGGVLVLSLYTVKKIFSGKSSSEHSFTDIEPNKGLMLTAASKVKLKIYEQFLYNIALFLLMIARNKLMNYLEQQGEDEDRENTEFTN
ncbi:MAG: hypothetical protein JJU28_03365 [Cyclobacteriaceae bacterium]|nr:hypothetical protein [Cyclobacteriaceae bacterium]